MASAQSLLQRRGLMGAEGLLVDDGARRNRLANYSWPLCGKRSGGKRAARQLQTRTVESYPSFCCTGRMRSCFQSNLQSSRPRARSLSDEGLLKRNVAFVRKQAERRCETLDFRIYADLESSESVTDWEPIATAAAATMAAQMVSSNESTESSTERSGRDQERLDGASQHMNPGVVNGPVRSARRTSAKQVSHLVNGTAAREHLVQELLNGHDHAVPLGASAVKGGAFKVAVDVDEGERLSELKRASCY
jgi:hypothetical protein